MAATTSAPLPSRWTGLAPDVRRAERRRLLVDAAFDLLGTEGADATTVRAVCARARLNPRYFYESFDGLDALLVAVYDHTVETLRDAVLAAQAAAPKDPRARVRAAVATIVGFIDDDHRRGRVLYVEALGNEAVNRQRRATGLALVELVEQHAVEQGGRPMPAGEQVGRMAAAILVGGLSELLVAWLDGRIDVERDRLVDDTTDLFLGLGLATTAIATTRPLRNLRRRR